MNTKIKNLSNKEEWIVLDLKNMQHQVGLFLKSIEKRRGLENIDQDKLEWFENVFKYYQDQLLPALQESAEMEERHLIILENNPDDGFSPLTKEVEYHQALYREFAKRFESIYKEFHQFKY